MTHKRGSVGWLLAAETASHLRRQADIVETADPTKDEHFTTIVSYALKYWGVKAAELADEFGVNLASVQRWADGKNFPQPYARQAVFDAIIKMVRSQVDELEASLKESVATESV